MALFPEYDDLTDEQQEVCEDIESELLVVSGPPGTGKTVVAFWRARQLLAVNEDVRIVMYNNTLQRYVHDWEMEVRASASIPANSPKLKIDTFHKWIWDWLTSGRSAFYSRNELASFNFNTPWDEILDEIEERQRTGRDIPKWPNLIIDEGQDLDLGFYRVLERMRHYELAPTAMVSADENQIITNSRTTITEMCERLGCSTTPDGESHHILTQNFRNTAEIHETAKHFYSGAKTGIASAPQRTGDKPILYVTSSNPRKKERLIKMIRSRPALRSAVIVKRKSEVKRITEFLEQQELPGTTIQHYVSGPGNKELAKSLDFDSPDTVTVLTADSCKGLEFDAVYIHDLDKWDGAEQEFKNKFYVMSSRSREFLEFQCASQNANSLEMMPQNLARISE